MIVIKNYLGSIDISKHFFQQLIGETLTDCFGVVDTNVGNAKQTLLNSVPFFGKKRYIEKGVNVRRSGDMLEVDLHITVIYGINVNAVVKNIQNKVSYAVEEQTDISVEKVNVFIDAIKS